MFHLVHKPLTTTSFLVIDLHCCPFSSCLLPPSVSPSLSVSRSHSVPHVAGEWAHVVPISHFGNSHCLSVYSLFLPSLSCHPPPQFSDDFFFFYKLSSLFFMAVVKGLLAEGNGDEERHTGWFPSATYLRAMGLEEIRSQRVFNEDRKSLRELQHFLLWSVGGGRSVSLTINLLKWSWIHVGPS